jgi:hypothetical protein
MARLGDGNFGTRATPGLGRDKGEGDAEVEGRGGGGKAGGGRGDTGWRARRRAWGRARVEKQPRARQKGRDTRGVVNSKCATHRLRIMACSSKQSTLFFLS